MKDDPADRRPPVRTPPILLAKTQPLLRGIQKRIGHPLITYWNGPNGS